MNRFLGALTIALIASTVARAAVPLATAPVYGGATQAQVICSVANFSGQSTSISSVVIAAASGAKLTLASNSCGTGLANGAQCSFTASLKSVAADAHYCLVNDGDTPTVIGNERITVDIVDTTGTVLASEAGR